MPDRVKSFREIDSSENRLKARFGFVRPIQNGRRKVQNLIYRGRPGQKPAWQGEWNYIPERRVDAIA